MNIKSQLDFYAGIMFSGVGCAFAWGATNYPVGSSANMGPGFFPLMLGVLLSVLGAIVILGSLSGDVKEGQRIGAIAWKPLFFIISSNLIFGVMLGGLPSIGLPSFGLVIGIYALTFLACAAGDKFSIKEALVLATLLSAMSYLVFIVLLNLQMPVWPAFIGA